MEKIITSFISEAAKASDFHLVLGYQWILNASETSQFDVLDQFLIEKAKGA